VRIHKVPICLVIAQIRNQSVGRSRLGNFLSNSCVISSPDRVILQSHILAYSSTAVFSKINHYYAYLKFDKDFMDAKNTCYKLVGSNILAFTHSVNMLYTMLPLCNREIVSDIYCKNYSSYVLVVKLWGLPGATALRIKDFLRS